MSDAPLDSIDLALLAARAMRPSRTGLAAAGEVVGACADPRDAWERLASLGCIPHAWVVNADRRGFALACRACDCDGWKYSLDDWGTSREACEVCDGYGWRLLADPPDLDACLALASDPVGVASVGLSERLAKGDGEWLCDGYDDF